MTIQNQIDHFAIGADSLEQGAEFLKDLTGADIPRGGKHTAMSTHNCVAQAGNSAFLEIIAIDPEAPAPGRIRWFTLDDPVTQARVKDSPVALCWVVGTSDLDGIIAASPVDLGEVVTFTRGDRSWRLTVPKDGSLPEQGLLPAFIEWSPGPHPSAGMQDVGIALRSINVTHPDPAYFAELLDKLSIAHLVNLQPGEQAALSFTLRMADEKETIVS